MPMNLTVYRHLSIPWLVMRDGLRFMPEGPGKFEVVGHARTVKRRWWSGRCGTDCWMTSDTDCFGDLQRVRTAAKQLRRQTLHKGCLEVAQTSVSTHAFRDEWLVAQ